MPQKGTGQHKAGFASPGHQTLLCLHGSVSSICRKQLWYPLRNGTGPPARGRPEQATVPKVQGLAMKGKEKPEQSQAGTISSGELKVRIGRMASPACPGCSFLITTGAKLNLAMFMLLQHRTHPWEKQALGPASCPPSTLLRF